MSDEEWDGCDCCDCDKRQCECNEEEGCWRGKECSEYVYAHRNKWYRVNLEEKTCPYYPSGKHGWVYVIGVDYTEFETTKHYFVCHGCNICGESDVPSIDSEKRLYRQLWDNRIVGKEMKKVLDARDKYVEDHANKGKKA